jgi:hypothetical protein
MTSFFYSLIWKLLHALRYLKNKSYLSDFWISIVKRYSMSKLSKEQIEWIIKAKVNGNFTDKEIADVQVISISSLQQLYREYKRTGVIHVQKRAGRHKRPVPESVRNEIVELYRKYRISASYIGKILREEGLHIDNDRINQGGWLCNELA